jgi:hypothetical protein
LIMKIGPRPDAMKPETQRVSQYEAAGSGGRS